MVRILRNGPPTHPGEMLLEEFLKSLKMTQSELAEKLGVSYLRVNKLIHGKREKLRNNPWFKFQSLLSGKTASAKAIHG